MSLRTAIFHEKARCICTLQKVPMSLQNYGISMAKAAFLIPRSASRSFHRQCFMTRMEIDAQTIQAVFRRPGSLLWPP
jgi:hypothetical protein